jgi:alpha-ketoglutarate-dependent taurine dioxygenase
MINPSTGGTVYENQYNCYTNLQTETQQVWSGYMVTYQHFGRYYQKFVYNRPHGKYITIMSNEG